MYPGYNTSCVHAGNAFTGQLQADWSFPNLHILNLSTNALSGSLPLGTHQVAIYMTRYDYFQACFDAGQLRLPLLQLLLLLQATFALCEA